MKLKTLKQSASHKSSIDISKYHFSFPVSALISSKKRNKIRQLKLALDLFLRYNFFLLHSHQFSSSDWSFKLSGRGNKCVCFALTIYIFLRQTPFWASKHIQGLMRKRKLYDFLFQCFTILLGFFQRRRRPVVLETLFSFSCCFLLFTEWL